MADMTFFAMGNECDNPDQRMVQDAHQFCSIVADLFRTLAATPFKVVFYSVWMGSITSWPALLAVYGFFVAGAFIQRWAAQRHLLKSTDMAGTQS